MPTKKEKKPSRRTNAKDEVQRIADLFARYIDKPMNISFGKFNFPIIIQEIKLAKITDMRNAPDKRIDDEGKKYTPPVMQLVTNEGYLYFVLEDITIVSIVNGYRIITSSVEINFKLEDSQV